MPMPVLVSVRGYVRKLWALPPLAAGEAARVLITDDQGVNGSLTKKPRLVSVFLPAQNTAAPHPFVMTEEVSNSEKA